MKKTLQCLIASTLLIVATGIAAQTAQELLSACRPVVTAGALPEQRVDLPPTFEAGFCWGSFAAIQEISRHIDQFGKPFFGVCAPATSKRSQLVAVFVAYAEKNPQRWHENGTLLAIESLQLAFPCKSGKKP